MINLNTMRSLAYLSTTQAALRREKEVMQLGSIFGNPAKEGKLISHIKTVASSVRNNFREDVSL